MCSRETPMQHISTTPFGRRPVTAGLLAAQARAGTESDCAPADKWAVLRDLGQARLAFGLTDRDLAVLAALVSFHREAEIAGDSPVIVFPSNAALSQRAHGMAESTLRRHLAALVGAGILLRHDSPNGKRYAVQGWGEGLDRAFGFDLAPLARRAEEITEAARLARLSAERLRRLRESIVLRLRDCEKLVAYAVEELPGNWDALADAVVLTKRQLRRKLDMTALQVLDAQVSGLAERVNKALQPLKTEKSDGNDGEVERHIQYSTKPYIDSEPCKEKARAEPVVPEPEGEADPKLPLYLVLRACPEIRGYAPHGIHDWRDLIAAAAFVRGMIGISADAWDEAQHRMTPAVAAIAVACILQSFDRIQKPGGYLRALARKAEDGAFSPGPMVMALLRVENGTPA